MKTETIEIVDRGRGPQLSTTRITVLDTFYHLHRGHGFEVIQEAMPSLSRAEFDAVLRYVDIHRDCGPMVHHENPSLPEGISWCNDHYLVD